jgi:L-lactate dehydrogenase complex protein LldF
MTEGFQPRVRRALADPVLQQALDRNAERRRAAWASAFASLSDPAETRRRAAEIRRRSVEHLPRLLARFVEEAERRGIVVHRAATAADACGVILGLLRDRGVRRVIKAKSMVTEEIGLNRALAAAGVQAVETDLGEFIVQLRGEPPAHITAPAIHLRREEVARTFETHLGMRYTTDVEAITAAARRALRDDFLEAQAGISGVNFGVAETGMLCLVTNEGNGRMVTTLPPLHIAVMGAERVVETLADLSVMLDVLPRAGTGQRRTSYVSLLAGPRRASDPDGPRERHLVIVDGGRLGLRDSPLAESLACIRCGACLNACPIYQEIGGHAYGSVYPGPIGSVVSPGLWGTAAFGHLATASTLCGACRDACPVAIDLPAMLLHIRAARVDQGRPPFWMRAGVAFVASILASPTRFAVGLRLAAGVSRLMPARAGWIRRLPPPLNRWTTSRDFPPVASRPFRARWASLSAKVVEPAGGSTSSVPPRNQTPPVREPQDRRTRFVAAARDAGCVVIECARAQLADRIADALGREGVTEVLAWEEEPGEWGALFEGLKVQGIRILGNDLVPGGRAPKGSSSVGAGLTGAVAGLADAGTLVLPSGAGRPLSASLLPPIHLAVLEERNLYDSLEAWLASDGDRWLSQESTVALITGPSRTADIEMTLTIGVHGPGKVVVFVVR